jgi:2-amino-4-hydroxy-6-hydroxymethyldihydropteridine diphosphokinase
VSRAVIALGANLGDRGSTLRAAAHELLALPGVRPVASSHEVESVAVTLDGPDDSKPRYRNAVVVVETDLGPEDLLAALHRVEDAHGRTREVRWGDRTLDLDVVAVDDLSIDTATLTVPHPRAHERAFVLAPWLDADPDAVHPTRGPVVTLLAAIGDDTSRVDEPRLFDALVAEPTDPATAADPGDAPRASRPDHAATRTTGAAP